MKSSLVILTYNELYEGTIPCVESIYRYTNINDFELIIVDNASKDATPQYLQELKDKYPNVKIKLNKDNKGFAGGMNQGIRLADGEFIILLNNDILASPNWLENLIKPMIENSEIGLVGPITNCSGNEQCVSFEGMDKNNYVDFIKNYLERQKGEVYFTNRLAFFCVAISKSALEKIGLLDENFGIGWFEDDDYCLRMINAGYKIVITEDCFIYHLGSLSFSKVAIGHAKKNELYFTQKHNCSWTITNGAIAYSEKIKADLDKYINSSQQTDPNIERIVARFKCFQSYLNHINTIERDFREEKKRTAVQKINRMISSPERYFRNNVLKKFFKENG